MTEPQVTPERLKGHVKWFNSAKGFGFITVEGSEDEVFVHQSNIDTTGFRSLQEGEEVEFDLVIGDDGKKKAFHVTGPGGAPPMGSMEPPRAAGFGGGRGGGMRPFDAYAAGPPPYGVGGSPAGYGAPPPGQQQQNSPPGGTPPGGAPPAPGMPPPGPGYYPPMPGPEAAYMAAGYYPMGPGGGFPGYPPMFARGRGQFFPGGRNWAGARPPPPGQPGFSSGLQVVVHNLPWDCTWQALRDAFADCGEIERADVVFDSRGRSRGFGIVRFPNKEAAEAAVDKMNNATIGGRVVSVRLDRFA